MAHELLLGKPPWEGTDTVQIMACILNEEVPSLRTHEPALPSALDDVVRRCLAKSPTARFATMEELVEALEDIASQHRLSMMPPSTVRSAPLRMGRWVLAFIVIATLAALATNLAVGRPRMAPPNSDEGAPAASSQR